LTAAHRSKPIYVEVFTRLCDACGKKIAAIAEISRISFELRLRLFTETKDKLTKYVSASEPVSTNKNVCHNRSKEIKELGPTGLRFPNKKVGHKSV
jgi:hypothetical protein